MSEQHSETSSAPAPSTPTASAPAPGRPGRYQRSVSGMIGAMIVLLLAVAAFVAFRAITRDTPDRDPVAVDYRAAVAEQQRTGRTVVYPSALPEDWIATSFTYEPGTRPGWGLGMLTDDGTYAGIWQQEEDVEDLLETYVDEEPRAEDPITIGGSIAREWDAYSDEAGDHAYAADLGEETVLVYGSASEEDLQMLLELVTTAPID